MLNTSAQRTEGTSGRTWVQGIGGTLLERGEPWFVVAVLLVQSGVLLPFLYESGVVPNPGLDPLGQAIRMSMLLFIVVHALRQPGKFLGALKAQKLSLCVALVATASAAWSPMPGRSLRVAILFTTTTAFGCYLAERYRFDELIRLIGWALAVAVGASLLILVAAPGYGFSYVQGGFRGAFAHKNFLGMYMVLSALTLTLIAKDTVRYRWVPWIGAGAAVMLLMLSRSGTGVAVLAGLCALVPLYNALRHQRGLRIPATIIAVLLGAGALGVFLYDRAPLVAILGKDPTLTGRTDLWAALIGWAWQRPWLGYGLNGFWDVQGILSGVPGADRGLGAVVRGVVVHGHNGLLDLWLDLGLLGVTIYLAGFVGAVVTALAYCQATRKTIDLWPVSFLSFLLLYNITEDAILREWGLWTMLVATVGSLRLHRPERELELPWRQDGLGDYDLDTLTIPPGAGLRVRPTASLGVRASLRAHGRRRPPPKV